MSVGAGRAAEPAGRDERALLGVVEKLGQLRLELVLDGLVAVLLGDAEPGPDDLGQRPEGDVLAERQALAAVPVEEVREPVDVLLELPAQARLADSGRSRTPPPAAAGGPARWRGAGP